jgi:hypothetical protein
MAESYQDIMSRLNGGQQAEKPKAANDFATYVRTLLENPNPQGGMMGDAAAYYADPFRKQNAINQAILDEELAKKKAEEEAAKAAAGGGGMGMMRGSSGGDSSVEQGIDPAVAAYLEAENMGARGRRNNALMNVAGTLVAGYPIGDTSGALGMTDSMGFTTAGRMNQMAYQYNKTPDFLKPFLPDSYANAAGFINQSDSIFSGMNPNGNVNMGVQQAAMLAAQDEGLFANPQERADWYASNSGGDSGGGDSGGGYTGNTDVSQSDFGGYGSEVGYG